MCQEYLLPLAPPDGSKSRVAEFGFLTRIVAVYTRISDNIFAYKHATDDDTSHAKPNVAEVIRDGENALKVRTPGSYDIPPHLLLTLLLGFFFNSDLGKLPAREPRV